MLLFAIFLGDLNNTTPDKLCATDTSSRTRRIKREVRGNLVFVHIELYTSHLWNVRCADYGAVQLILVVLPFVFVFLAILAVFALTLIPVAPVICLFSRTIFGLLAQFSPFVTPQFEGHHSRLPGASFYLHGQRSAANGDNPNAIIRKV
ncbi:MAG TPA: hypothetical protein VJ875_00090 [Pyrinomonadaceae bacterium]|nr:hypothetical protein [Pyrinomonadaceae bacterium]